MQPGTQFETKTDYVYRVLRDEIVTGKLASGERLRLAKLAAQLNTSEMPVREALRMLQRDGLVQMESHRGATVARVDWDKVVEAVSVRMHLEVLAVREATSKHTPDSLSGAATILDEMDAALRTSDPDAFSDGNRRFHSILYEPTENTLLKDQIQELWDLVWRERTRSLFRLHQDRAELAQREHRALLSAVKGGDADGAAEWAQRHRANTLTAWRKAIHLISP